MPSTSKRVVAQIVEGWVPRLDPPIPSGSKVLIGEQLFDFEISTRGWKNGGHGMGEIYCVAGLEISVQDKTIFVESNSFVFEVPK